MENKVVAIVVGVAILLIITSILIGMSVQTVEYYEYGLMKVKSTGVVQEEVYHQTRIFEGPDREMITYPSTAQFLNLHGLIALSQDNLPVTFAINLQYFLRPDDIYTLYRTHKFSYKEIIQKIAMDSVKDSATKYTIQQFIEERPTIKEQFFNSLRSRIEGTCCLKDCSTKRRKCLPGCIRVANRNCTRGVFVELRYFQLGYVDFHESIQERKLAALILTEDRFRKQHEQNATIVREETEVKVQKLNNAANEVRMRSRAEAALTRKTADAQYIKAIEDARGSGLRNLYGNLSITDDKEKASFDYLRTLQQSRHVHISVGYDQYLTGLWKKP